MCKEKIKITYFKKSLKHEQWLLYPSMCMHTHLTTCIYTYLNLENKIGILVHKILDKILKSSICYIIKCS